MAIKCERVDCKFNMRRYCTLDYIELDENGVCTEYEPDERKRIVEYNTRMVRLLEKLGKMNIDEKAKEQMASLLILGMKTEDGEHVIDKIMEIEEKERDGK